MTRIVTVHGTITVLDDPDALLERMGKAPGDWTKTFMPVERPHMSPGFFGRKPIFMEQSSMVWVRLSDIVRIEETP